MISSLKKLTLLLGAWLLCLSIAGCGQTGELQLPPKKTKTEHESD